MTRAGRSRWPRPNRRVAQVGDVSQLPLQPNGECPSFGTSYGYIALPGPFAIQSDGSFSVNDHITISNQAIAAVSIAGKVTSDGAVSGSVRVDLVFPNGVGCMSTGIWTAHAR